MKFSIWDAFSIMLLLGIAVLILLFGAIFMDPASAYNPFPLPTPIPTVFVPTATPTLRSLPGYQSPTAPATATPAGLRATSTPQPSRTSFVLPTYTYTFTATNTPTNTPTLTNTPTVTNTPTNTPVPTATVDVRPTQTAAAQQTGTAQALTETAAYPAP